MNFSSVCLKTIERFRIITAQFKRVLTTIYLFKKWNITKQVTLAPITTTLFCVLMSEDRDSISKCVKTSGVWPQADCWMMSGWTAGWWSVAPFTDHSTECLLQLGLEVDGQQSTHSLPFFTHWDVMHRSFFMQEQHCQLDWDGQRGPAAIFMPLLLLLLKLLL